MSNVYPNTFPPSKKTRDFALADTVISFADTTPYVVAAGTTIAPDTLVLLDAINPITVVEATTGTPVVGTDTVYGVAMTYSTNTATTDGQVVVAKLLPNQTFRVKLNTALANQAAVDAIIGNQYLIQSSTDADGFIHQVLDNSVASSGTAMIMVVDADYTTDTALVKIIA